MAEKNQIPISIDIRRNNNKKSTGYQKYYGVINRVTTLSTRGLANHIKDHGLGASLADIYTVLMCLNECIPELVAQGTAVKLEGLGIFYPSAKSKGVTLEELKADGFNPAKQIEGVRVRFMPDSTKLDNLTAKQFKAKCSLEAGNVIESDSVTIDGKAKAVRKLTPIATFIADLNKDPDP